MSGKRARRSRTASYVMIGAERIRFDVPRVMGVLNVTPDSFSGDGLSKDIRKAISRGRLMFDQKADIVDVGGESTRPGAEPVAVEVEIERTVRVIKELGKSHPGRISVDTYKPEVAELALDAGASIVNDVTGLRNREMRELVAEHGASAIIMHMKGEPRNMQDRPRYRDVVGDISSFLSQRIAAAEQAGIDPRAIMVDPGIGFGKTVDHNLEILARLREFKSLGKPIVIGVSRKSFIGKLTGLPANQRLEGSIAAAVVSVRNGADMVRVHDVAETVRALSVSHAILSRDHSVSRT